MSDPTKTIAVNAAGEKLVCSECGESVTRCTPVFWTYPWGPPPEFSHYVDGEALCPVISTADGVSGYVPAEPVTRREFDDTNGCPCDGQVYVCACSCSSCTCRIDDQFADHLDALIEGLITGEGFSDE